MYDYFSGELAYCDLTTAVVDCGGVGYKLSISLNTHKLICKQKSVKLFAYMNVREDVMELFGFADAKERGYFTMLLAINGVGPKAALAILSSMLPEQLALSIATGDYKALTKAQGIGTKTAQRICLELKDKFSSDAVSGVSEVSEFDAPTGDARDDAIDGLTALGYSRADARNAVMKCSAENTGDLIRQALRLLSRV